MPTEVVDIEDIMKAYAKDVFDRTKDKEQKRIPDEALEYTINWKRVKFIHAEPVYGNETRPKHPQAQVLFKTFFTNNTDREQDYSFQTQRVTRSSCNVEIERGVMMGQEMGVQLQTPCEVFQANAGFKREITLNRLEGEIAEEELSWGVDSQIRVAPKSQTLAELIVSETEYGGHFTIQSRFEGNVMISITNTRENNCLVKTVEGNVVNIFKREIENGLKGFRVEKNSVCFETKGRCHFRYGIEQHVKLSQQPLNNNDVQ
ncbi:uncharacterized protein LOC106161564 [Lingula anatina]|uniref:Uncharacterized protein LOC106161564 n=1 Tax=Lingula anatina TaxID=7574 RepID=A0A1S3I6Y0_LINAN|nr:uncharacterized protein LOC106161564 [Lingula anatina]XP_013394013.1 uncharacterized protein LOC106161564 [Lingula anatina]|eukprot:XP_013394012.1 uncharacterized protein LOC106161564 [Lingula anatina]